MSTPPGFLQDPLTGLYVPGPYAPPTVILGQQGADLPLIPAGVAFNVAWRYSGATGTTGISAIAIQRNPANGPIWLSGGAQQYQSVIGEYFVQNLDTALSLNIVISGNVAQGAPAGGYVIETIGPGAVWSESNRRINPAVLAFVCATAATSMSIKVILWAYGSNV